MDIFERVKSSQNKDDMLKRALEVLVQLYTDKTHFVYELLQNAEDAGASEVKFVQYEDRLEVMHNGVPFSDSNLCALCDIAMSDKRKADGELNKIGEFGVGFKSVFGICEKVFVISRPKEEDLKNGYEQFVGVIENFTNFNPVEDEGREGDGFEARFTTKFVFPYAVGHSFSGFDSVEKLKSAVSERLKDLGITTLLFMRNLKSIDYEINLPQGDKGEKGEDGEGAGIYRLEKRQIGEHCWLVSAFGHENSKNPQAIEGKKGAILYKEGKNEQTQYLVFSRAIEWLPSKTVDLAFSVAVDESAGEGKEKFVFKPAKNPYVSVYFPTEVESKLKFIVQGPFRTTPNRSNVPSENEENRRLAKEASRLLKDVVLELRDKNALDLSFLNVLPIEESVFSSFPLFRQMFFDVKELLLNEKTLPCRDGTYQDARSVKIARGEKLAELFEGKLLSEFIGDGTEWRWLPAGLTEANTKYNDLYNFLTSDLTIQVLSPQSLKRFIDRNGEFFPRRSDEWLVKFYRYCESTPHVFDKERNESENMRLAVFVKTSGGKFVSPYRKTQEKGKDASWLPNVFLPIKSQGDMDGILFVDKALFESCKSFFTDTLCLKDPNNYDVFVKDFKVRHENLNPPTAADESDAFFKAHVRDIENLLFFVQKRDYQTEIKELIEKHLYLRCRKNGFVLYLNPNHQEVYFPIANEGRANELNIEAYFKNVVSCGFVDAGFYKNRKISSEDLKKLGVKDSVAVGEDETEGIYEVSGPGRKPSWYAEGSFRWMLTLDRLGSVLDWIEKHPSESDAKEKSKFILSFLRANEDKLKGEVFISGNNGGTYLAYAEIVCVINMGKANSGIGRKWLFTKGGGVASCAQVSKYDLDPAVYGNGLPSDSLCETLGFRKSEEEKRKEIKAQYDNMPEEERRMLSVVALESMSEKAADELPPKVKTRILETQLEQLGLSREDLDAMAKNKAVKMWHDAPAQDAQDFPRADVINWDSLKRHVAKTFASAPHVKYEYETRKIRTSKSYPDAKAYLGNMYRYGSVDCACQMCHGRVLLEENELCEIAKTPELELTPLNLCFCPNCARKYERLWNDKELVDDFANRIAALSDNEIENASVVKIAFADKSIWFTQVHAAEIRELLRLQLAKKQESTNL